MGRPSDSSEAKRNLRDRIIGLGERSARKSYYPQLQQRIRQLEEQSAAMEKMLRDMEAERARAAESEERFRLLVEGVTDYGLFMLDPDGAVTSWNPGAERIFGYPAGEIMGRGIAVFHDPAETTRDFPAETLRAAAERGHLEMEGVRVRRDGSRFWADDTLTPLFDREDRLRGFAALTRDITEHRRLEEQLRQSQKMEAIGRLAGGVAHDFNNLLTIMQGYASLLLESAGKEPKSAESVGQILLAADRGARLVRQLLAFSRMQAMRPAAIDLNRVVGDMTLMLQRILGEDISLSDQYGAHLPPVYADAAMLEQVMLNLAVNARDAMPNGGRLELRTSWRDFASGQLSSSPDSAPGRYVCLGVSDTGSGIAPEILPHIFEPFFTTKEPGKGTGLGLASVYGIVRQHHGWVEVDSQMGRGTTFTVCLPAVEAVPHAVEEERSGNGALPRGDEEVLLVEDEEALRSLMRHVLERCGYTVLQARSGVEALEIWEKRKHEIALLLTDMVMPSGITGSQLAERMKAEAPELKVLYISGYSTHLGAATVPLVEGVNFLQKPFRVSKLAQAVREILDRL